MLILASAYFSITSSTHPASLLSEVQRCPTSEFCLLAVRTCDICAVWSFYMTWARSIFILEGWCSYWVAVWGNCALSWRGHLLQAKDCHASSQSFLSRFQKLLLYLATIFKRSKMASITYYSLKEIALSPTRAHYAVRALKPRSPVEVLVALTRGSSLHHTRLLNMQHPCRYAVLCM